MPAANAAVGSQIKPVLPCSTSSVGPPLSVHVTTAFPDANASGSRTVVLVERRKTHGPAVREVIDQLVVRDLADQADAASKPEAADQCLEAARASPSPAMTARTRPPGRASARTSRSIRFSGVRRETAKM